MGCAAPSNDDGGSRDRNQAEDLSCDGAGDSVTYLVRAMGLEEAQDGAVSDGFDLDGLQSDEYDPGGCYVEDYTSPVGVGGIDNAMSLLMPLLATTEAVVLEDLMQDSINNGAMLMMFGLDDLDDEHNDECVDVTLFMADGDPMLGNDGWLLPNQTLEPDPASPRNTGSAVLKDGVLEVGPYDVVELPLTVLDLSATLRLHNARIRLTRHEDGSMSGVMAGGLEVQDIVETVTLQNVDPIVYELLAPVLEVVADLAPDADGVCQQLSITTNVELVPAFLFED
jgi:hypothetical protein